MSLLMEIPDCGCRLKSLSAHKTFYTGYQYVVLQKHGKYQQWSGDVANALTLHEVRFVIIKARYVERRGTGVYNS